MGELIGWTLLGVFLGAPPPHRRGGFFTLQSLTASGVIENSRFQILFRQFQKPGFPTGPVLVFKDRFILPQAKPEVNAGSGWVNRNPNFNICTSL